MQQGQYSWQSNIPLLTLVGIALYWYGVLYAVAEEANVCSTAEATLESVQGTVDIRRTSRAEWTPASIGMILCAGDSLRVKSRSRAAIFLEQAHTSIQLDQHSTITLPGKTSSSTTILDLLEGAARFLSRTPTSVKVTTPFVNAHIKGTEFLVRVRSNQAAVFVFEGTVLTENRQGTVLLKTGQVAQASANRKPELLLGIPPTPDTVYWALYYPPVIDYHTLQSDHSQLRAALLRYREGDLTGAFTELDGIPPTLQNSRYLQIRAGLLLTVGRVDEARSTIEQALMLDNNDSVALALQSIVALVHNEKELALQLAERAIQVEPDVTVGYMALSYAQQARFNIEHAFESAERASRLAPNNALVQARLAELSLAQGKRQRAIEYAQRAVELEPQLSRTQSVLGFANLTAYDLEAASAAFRRAIHLDPADSLPRLGFGLTNIRKGELDIGTRDIEIAVSLDPENALIRSYLGKSYYEQRRGDLAEIEFENAKRFDPQDPTPWFYGAIHKQATNRPIEAFTDLQNAIKLNGNRAVYRSKQLLDDDLAARGAALGRIFNELGFGQRGLVEAWNALSANPLDYSAHRLLADTYSSLPRHDIARVSELLQSQLLQPVNITPVQPRLAESDLFLLGGLGPAEPSLNEFNSLFQRQRFSLLTSGLIGTQDTYSDEVVHSGLWKRLSYSLGQFHYQTAGTRPNNDLRTDIGSLFAQAAITPAVNLQVELRHQNTLAGDLTDSSDLSLVSDTFRQEFTRDTIRAGLSLQPSPRGRFVGNFAIRDFTRKTSDNGLLEGEDAAVAYMEALEIDLIGDLTASQRAAVLRALPQLNTRLTSLDEQETLIHSQTYEIQYSEHRHRWSFIAGLGMTSEDRTKEFRETKSQASIASGALRESLPPQFLNLFEKPIRNRNDSETTHIGGYLYTNIDFPSDVVGTVGLELHSADRNGPGVQLDWNQISVNPKVGLVWRPFSGTVLRAAWLKSVKRPLVSGQTIEPTHIAGFNQFFDDVSNARGERYGVAFDQMFQWGLMAGVEISWRRTKTPIFNTGRQIHSLRLDEELHRGYVNWVISERLTLTAEYFYERIESRVPGIVAGLPDHFASDRIPLSLRYFNPMGISMKVGVNYVKQSAEFFAEPPATEEFWTIDTSVAYRMPKRSGIVTVGVKNLLDEHFVFRTGNFNLGDEPVPSTFVPERTVFGQVTLAF